MERRLARSLLAFGIGFALSCASSPPSTRSHGASTLTRPAHVACGDARFVSEEPAASPEPVVARDVPTAARVIAPLPPMPTHFARPRVPWREMTHAERAHFMHQHVAPTMAGLFRAYDPVRYANVECATCHGPNAVQKRFHMPTRALRPLPHPDTPAWDALAAEVPRMHAFMTERVAPAMAHAIGVRPFDPTTGSGFDCFQCHTLAE